jgi:hypothetical protein
MRRLTLLVIILSACCGVTRAGDDQAKVVCDKLPYRLGHLVILNSTDLRDSPRAITKKENKELGKKQDRIQRECDAFVSKHPGNPVSTEFSFTVTGFAAIYGRCESFCGTEKDRFDLIMREVDAMAPHK